MASRRAHLPEFAILFCQSPSSHSTMLIENESEAQHNYRKKDMRSVNWRLTASDTLLKLGLAVNGKPIER